MVLKLVVYEYFYTFKSSCSTFTHQQNTLCFAGQETSGGPWKGLKNCWLHMFDNNSYVCLIIVVLKSCWLHLFDHCSAEELLDLIIVLLHIILKIINCLIIVLRRIILKKCQQFDKIELHRHILLHQSKQKFLLEIQFHNLFPCKASAPQ